MSPVMLSFNSRARKGRDDTVAQWMRMYDGFNSRARKGRDIIGTTSPTKFVVSIHAPARGATALV